MSNVIDIRRKARPMRAGDHGMTGYQRALAKQRMDDAMLLGHMMLRAVARVRTAMQGLGRSAGDFLSPRGTQRARRR